jgi:hypothetical protein
MKKLKNYLLAIMAVTCFLTSSLAQDGCPINFPFTESLCFTNHSNKTEFGSVLTEGCDYQVCVKIKPKPSCYPECTYASEDGYWSTYCVTVSVGNTQCISIPSTTKPITDCWDIDITLKVVGHPATLVKAMNAIIVKGVNGEAFSDDCENNDNDWTVIKSVLGTGDFNFGIYLRRFTH